MSERVSNGFFLSASYLLINTSLLFTNWCQRVPKSRACLLRNQIQKI